jgi:hypothetical protein
VGLAIFGVRLGQACAQLTHARVKFSRVAQRRFLTAPSVCRRPNCPLTRQAKQRMGRIVRGSDCHSQRKDPLLRGRTERLVGLSDPCGVGLSQYENICGANRYSVGWCWSECHSVQLGGGAIVKAPWIQTLHCVMTVSSLCL